MSLNLKAGSYSTKWKDVPAKLYEKATANIGYDHQAENPHADFIIQPEGGWGKIPIADPARLVLTNGKPDEVIEF